jgi:hypothetical protein
MLLGSVGSKPMQTFQSHLRNWCFSYVEATAAMIEAAGGAVDRKARADLGSINRRSRPQRNQEEL